MSSFLNFFTRSNSTSSMESPISPPMLSSTPSSPNTSSTNLLSHRTSLTSSMDGLFSRSTSMDIQNQNKDKESSYFRMLQVVEAGSL
ncbi:hypothetical protein DLAC_11635 [Tieghemostelium lacteum]|uniref:Uncharacterized protein n=1 Tax=Tieghemostelium lacteum TaxID=361077 RepID=A0A151ZGM4_TIELA|nr:hypothetical protein DLAC_11635 [Tieghemostelium lacteum]|eukprot:KYQ93014.1 hypothetical protein DLAC_11635 [Tieghemostelium lacteum]